MDQLNSHQDLKDRVYDVKPENLEDLVEHFRQEANSVSSEIIQNIVKWHLSYCER